MKEKVQEQTENICPKRLHQRIPKDRVVLRGSAAGILLPPDRTSNRPKKRNKRKGTNTRHENEKGEQPIVKWAWPLDLWSPFCQIVVFCPRSYLIGRSPSSQEAAGRKKHGRIQDPHTRKKMFGTPAIPPFIFHWTRNSLPCLLIISRKYFFSLVVKFFSHYENYF